MKPSDPRDPWTRLTAAARQARDPRDVDAPYGFSTRIAAMAFSKEHAPSFLFERFALRALSVACLLAIGSIALNYPALTAPAPIAEEQQAAAEDPLSILLDA